MKLISGSLVNLNCSEKFSVHISRMYFDSNFARVVCLNIELNEKS